jgi:hypothetical protein
VTPTDTRTGVEQRLDVIIHLLCAIVTKDMARKEAVLKLSATGLPPKDVAGVLGLTTNQVSVVLYDAKPAAAKARGKAKAEPNAG